MAGDHKCPVCQATFTRPQHVARHMRSHTGDRPYKCQHCGDQFARSDLLSRHINKCHASERPPTTTAPNQRRKGTAAASRATTSKQACDQCVQSTLPCDGANPCSKCVQRKYRCTYVKFHRQTAPSGPGHLPPPRTDTDLGLGASLYGASAAAPGSRYAQAPPHDEFAYSHGALATQAPQAAALYATQYSFNPALGSYAQQQGAATDAAAHAHDALDFAARYRQQAELLRRAGVIPPPGVQDVSSLQSGGGMPAYYAHGAWAEDGARKEVEQFDQYAYLDPARQHYARQQNQLQPVHSYGHDGSGNGYYSHGRSSSWDNQHSRRASFAESDGTSSVGGSSSVGGTSSIPSSTASSNGNASSELASHPRGGYAPPAMPTTSTTESSSRPSTAPGPSAAPGHARVASEGGGHDGFSSAFGLMSLDDPAVLAGLAPDAQPFFSGMGLATPTPAKEREARDRFGSLFSMAGAPATGRDSKDGVKDEPTLAGLTPRETETRELREFWRAYMRTPLSGGGPLGGPTPTAAGGMLGAPVASEASRPGLAGKRGLSRVSSLPSVKTPAREQAQYISGTMMPPVQRGTYAANSAADDLRSYEAAVLSRRAPMNLNLIPRRARAGSVAVTSPYDDGHASSASPPLQSAIAVPVRPSTANTYHPTAYTYDPNARAASSTASTDDGSGNSSDPERAHGRPSFKRLASQTLGPDQSKRPMYGHEGPDGSALDADDSASSDAEGQRIPRMMAAAAAERQRRMSAPSGGMPPPSHGVLTEAGYA